jgi:hypothetical protein
MTDTRDSDPDAPSLGVPGALAPGPARPEPPSVRAAIGFATNAEGGNRLLASVFAAIPIFGWLALHGWMTETQHRLVVRHPSPVPSLRLRDFFFYMRRGGAAWLLSHAGLTALATALTAVIVIANAGTLAAWVAAGAFPWIALALSVVALFGVTAGGSVLLGSMITRAELTEKLAPGLALADAWRDTRAIRRRTLVAYLWFVPSALVILTFGAMLCGVGILPAWVVVQVAAMHLRWQLYEAALRSGARLPAPKAPLLSPAERVKALPPKGGKQ